MSALKEIQIHSRRELDIYMNPQRQRILKCMDLNGIAMTPKQISVALGISASAITFHLKKLEELGLVELDHTEIIRGICAKFYKRVPATICLNGGVQDDLCTEKEALMDYLMNDIWRDFQQYLHSTEMPSNTELAGDMISGVCYLDEEAVRTLKHFMWEFQKKYSKPRENAAAWEVALLAFPGNRDDNQ